MARAPRLLAVPPLAGLLGLLALVGLAVGPARLGAAELMEVFLGTAPPRASAIVLQIRLPRLLLGISTGAALAVSGVLMQAVFRNPLAEPGLVGVSSGAALGAAAAIVLGTGGGQVGAVGVPLAAALGAALTTGVVLRLGQRAGATSTATLLLAGLAITSLANAGLGLLLRLASDAELRNLTFWMLGSLDGQSLGRVLWAGPLMVLPVVVALRWGTALDALLLGEAEALHLGVEVESLKRRALAAAALATGAAVALAGVIGFVGLMVPHLVRLSSGPGHARLLPRALLLGPCLVLSADLVARTALSPRELPIGVLTGLLGAPFFLFLLRRREMEDA